MFGKGFAALERAERGFDDEVTSAASCTDKKDYERHYESTFDAGSVMVVDTNPTYLMICHLHLYHVLAPKLISRMEFRAFLDGLEFIAGIFRNLQGSCRQAFHSLRIYL
jgi:hypothetical protein